MGTALKEVFENCQQCGEPICVGDEMVSLTVATEKVISSCSVQPLSDARSVAIWCTDCSPSEIRIQTESEQEIAANTQAGGVDETNRIDDADVLYAYKVNDEFNYRSDELFAAEMEEKFGDDWLDHQSSDFARKAQTRIANRDDCEPK